MLKMVTFAVHCGSIVVQCGTQLHPTREPQAAKYCKTMAITFKAVVYAHHRKQDGTYNVKVRITHNRVKRHVATNLYIRREDMTRGYKIKAQNVLDELKVIIDNYQRIAGTLPAERASVMSVDDVVEYITSYERNKEALHLDFIAFGRQVAADTRAQGRDGSARGYEGALNALQRFLQADTLPIQQLTVKLLEDFSTYLTAEPAQQYKITRGSRAHAKGTRAQSLYLGYLRVIHNKAKEVYNDEDAGIIRIPYSPFKKFKVPKQAPTRKRSITAEQLQAVMQAEGGSGTASRATLARDVFLLSFGLIGMNSVDLYRCTEYDGSRITYQRSKTRGRRADQATISIKVEPCLQPLLERYRDRQGKRVFNFYHRYSDFHTFNTAVNKGLKVIGSQVGIENLQLYAARHTWATIARNKCGIEKETIHEALNHVDESMKITDIYIDKDYSVQDAANVKVLKAVRFKP